MNVSLAAPLTTHYKIGIAVSLRSRIRVAVAVCVGLLALAGNSMRVAMCLGPFLAAGRAGCKAKRRTALAASCKAAHATCGEGSA